MGGLLDLLSKKGRFICRARARVRVKVRVRIRVGLGLALGLALGLVGLGLVGLGLRQISFLFYRERWLGSNRMQKLRIMACTMRGG